jgi:hypothetical protein
VPIGEIQLSLIESELITATFEANLEFWVSSMNMRLKELAASVEKASKQATVTADGAAAVIAEAQAKSATPLPRVDFEPNPSRKTGGTGMSTLSDLRNKVISARQARRRLVGDLRPNMKRLRRKAMTCSLRSRPTWTAPSRKSRS